METKKIFTVENKGVVDTENNKLVGVIGSTGSMDRHGESVNPMGWKLENFKKNPVIQWAHNYDQLPVGKAERVYVEDNALKFDIKFADTAFAKDVFKLFVDGILNAFSVGFIPLKWGMSGQDEFDIMEQELLELSVVPVPANPEALALVKTFASKYKLEASVEEKEDDKEEAEEVIETDKPEDKPAEEVVEVTPTDEVPEGAEVDEEEAPVVPDEVVPPVEEKPEEPAKEDEKKYDAKTLSLLKEIADSFKKADNQVGQGLALLKRLKTALQN